MGEKYFHELFAGSDLAHGVVSLNSATATRKRGCRIHTVREPATPEIWAQHLSGKTGLQIIPITAENVCKFGAIDVDVYGKRVYDAVKTRIEQHKLPLFAFPSKSGGLHLFLFCSEWVKAGLLRQKLLSFAAGIGLGTAEIFPKQIQIDAERGDIGNGINMPCFGSERGWLDGTADEFVENALKARISAKELQGLTIKPSDVLFEDGSPCLQHMHREGIKEGMRNKAMFNVGIYCKKKYGAKWLEELEGHYSNIFDDPLSSSEMQDIIKSLKKKEYNYTCTQSPLCSFCDRATCLDRTYGVGHMASAKYHTLTKLDTVPPIWTLIVEDKGTVELTSKQLRTQPEFQEVCIAQINYCPPQRKASEWTKTLNKLLEKVTIIDVPDEEKPSGVFLSMLHAFLGGRVQAKTLSEIALHKPFADTENRCHCFKVQDVITFFDKHKIRGFTHTAVIQQLKKISAKSVRSSNMRYWTIPLLPAFYNQDSGAEIFTEDEGDSDGEKIPF